MYLLAVAKKRDPFAGVRVIARTLPGVKESVSWGGPAWKVNGKLLACMATNKSAEPGSLVIVVDMDQRDEMIAAAPEIYYVTDHYVNYRAMLVRLERIHHDALRDLLALAFRTAQARAARTRSPRTQSRTPSRRSGPRPRRT